MHIFHVGRKLNNDDKEESTEVENDKELRKDVPLPRCQSTDF